MDCAGEGAELAEGAVNSTREAAQEPLRPCTPSAKGSEAAVDTSASYRYDPVRSDAFQKRID